jgi:hypothetical protein
MWPSPSTSIGTNANGSETSPVGARPVCWERTLEVATIKLDKRQTLICRTRSGRKALDEWFFFRGALCLLFPIRGHHLQSRKPGYVF